MTTYYKTTIQVISADNDDYNPAKMRTQEVIEQTTVTITGALLDYVIPIAPDSAEIGDGTFQDVIVYNRDTTNFITMSWRNADATTATQKIPAGRTVKVADIDGDGSVQCSFVADTAECMADIYFVK